MLAASWGGGNKSNRGLSGLFKIFLKIFYLDLPEVRVKIRWDADLKLFKQLLKTYFLLLRFPAPHYWLCNTPLDDFLSCILAYTKRLLYRIVSYVACVGQVTASCCSKTSCRSRRWSRHVRLTRTNCTGACQVRQWRTSRWVAASQLFLPCAVLYDSSPKRTVYTSVQYHGMPSNSAIGTIPLFTVQQLLH